MKCGLIVLVLTILKSFFCNPRHSCQRVYPPTCSPTTTQGSRLNPCSEWHEKTFGGWCPATSKVLSGHGFIQDLDNASSIPPRPTFLLFQGSDDTLGTRLPRRHPSKLC